MKLQNKDQIYRNLQEHIDVPPGTFPAAESGTDIKYLKTLFTPEEAQIALYLSPIKIAPIKTIYERAKKGGISLSIEEFQEKISEMEFKGLVVSYEEGYTEKQYKNAGGGGGGMIDFQVDRISKDLVEAIDKYHEDLFKVREKEKAKKANVPGLRQIPVQRAAPRSDKFQVRRYDDVRWLIQNNPGPFSIANCICRQMKDMRGMPCKYSDLRETCIQISPDHARSYLAMGIGRSITREELFEKLDQFEEAGFILMPENSQKPENICVCCGDCCGPLGAILKSPRPAELFASSYYAAVDPELCTGCGTCVNRCQLEARTLVDGKATINLDRCIGCGNCVVTCKTKASQLHKKKKEWIPPINKDATLAAQLAATSKTKATRATKKATRSK